ncbi:MAG: serine/threonine-protein kinase [Peptococcaceae bacterium]|nr:serine/threonine-protein kinase [Peptococcaceae bacterium]
MALPELGTVFDNQYKIIGSLGHGGFASALLAEDISSQEKVVLKFPDLAQLGDPAVYERFRRELAIGKLLEHPDLPTALFASEGSPPYLVLRFVEGRPLAEILGQKGKFPEQQAVEMVIHLLEAVEYCHRKGVYHRDLKPENLVLGPDGHLKILDFGIALMEGVPRVTWRGFSGLMGTPEYMAPEQIKGERGGARSDIYAVGCLLYHLLTGRPPFTGDNPLAIMHQHLTSDPRPLTELCPRLPPGIWAVVRRAMRRRKEERYGSALEMAKDLSKPEKVDLKWLNAPDSPLITVLTENKVPWGIIIGSVVLGLVLALVAVFLNWHR